MTAVLIVLGGIAVLVDWLDGPLGHFLDASWAAAPSADGLGQQRRLGLMEFFRPKHAEVREFDVCQERYFFFSCGNAP
jgi:hypothetical protein